VEKQAAVDDLKRGVVVKKTEKIGTIRPEDVKVRKKMPPATQVQKSPKDYDRLKVKKETNQLLDES